MPNKSGYDETSFPDRNAMTRRHFADGTVPDAFFSRAAHLAVGKTAVTTDQGSLTYEALAQGALRGANKIHHAIGGRKANIAILPGNPLHSATGILAILTAGCAYVPLDPNQPLERSRNILHDVEAKLVLADRDTLDLARNLSSPDCPCLELDEAFADGSLDRPPTTIEPEDRAYIIFTSGSTGSPKGVVHTHRSLLHKVHVLRRMTSIDSSDTVILIPPLTVGQSTGHLFATILSGGRLRPINILQSGLAGLASSIRRDHVTFYLSVPSIFRRLCATLQETDIFGDVRVVELAGELCLSTDFDLYRKHFAPTSRFVNWLAATEANIAANSIGYSGNVNEGIIPVGKALPDCEVVVLGQTGFGQPGEVGEIGVISKYLARGYWKDEALTDQRFIRQTDGRVLYKTGDVGRISAEGVIEVLGRTDSQVKISGMRVNMQEVETAILASGVAKGAVVQIVNRKSRSVLAAYFVPYDRTKEHSVQVEQIRRYLRQHLPEYMVPRRFIALPEIPVNATGKADRLALMDRKEPGIHSD